MLDSRVRVSHPAVVAVLRTMSRRCQIPAWLRVWVLGACWLWNSPGAAEEPGFAGTTLEAGLQESIRLFREGKHTAANGAFEQLDAVFGQEEEYRERSVQQVILPMRGYAALLAGNPAGAVEHLGRFAEDHPDAPEKSRAFALFALAQAHHAAGDLPAAITRYREFAELAADSPEAAIAELRLARLQMENGDTEAALSSLDALYASGHSAGLRRQARLRALRIASQAEDRERAVHYLLETPWNVEAMPEPAILAFAALPLGDYLLAAQRFDEAIAAYRLVPEQQALIESQRRKLREIHGTLERRSRTGMAGAAGIWTEHYRQLLQRLEAQLGRLESMEPYTGALYLRYGQAFARADRLHEAGMVFAEVAEDASFAEPLREEAHYRWIHSVQALEDWTKALGIASVFADRYPQSPKAPLVLFLNANAHQQMADHPAAIEILTRLLDRYPDHPHAGRWRFTRGFNRLLLGENSRAREDFAAYLSSDAETALATNAALWHALSWFFDKSYDPALAELDALLAQTPADHYLRPEMAYRRAAVLYAQRAHEPALQQINGYLRQFPEDQRRAEAMVLRGDILMGLGRLTAAANAFREVGPEALNLFPYAVFQVGKIHRALEDYDRLADHFRDYVERTYLAAHPRVSEALYWVGWARIRQERPADALPIFDDALKRFGNDPYSDEIGSIFAALHQLHPRLRRSAGEAPEPSSQHALLAARDFMTWLRGEAERARTSRKLTYFSRLRLYESNRLKIRGQAGAATAILLTMGEAQPLDVLDAEALGAVGLAWQAAGRPGAEKYFNRLLERYPDSPHRAGAWLGLGKLAFERGAAEEAAQWLEPLIEELPAHPLMPSASLLFGRTLVALGEPERAESVLEALLTLRSARGRLHAEALLQLGRAAEAAESPDRAIAYYQRVFNLYRAYPDLVGTAYLRSATLFEARGDLRAAWRTYREILFFDELTNPSVRTIAREACERLEPLLPPEPAKAAVADGPASAPAGGGEA